MWDHLQWAATVFGIAGAITNSVGGGLMRFTWPIWLVSNLACIAVLQHLGAHGLIVQQVFYLATTLVGGLRHYFPNTWRRCINGVQLLWGRWAS